MQRTKNKARTHCSYRYVPSAAACIIIIETTTAVPATTSLYRSVLQGCCNSARHSSAHWLQPSLSNFPFGSLARFECAGRCTLWKSAASFYLADFWKRTGSSARFLEFGRCTLWKSASSFYRVDFWKRTGETAVPMCWVWIWKQDCIIDAWNVEDIYVFA